MIFRFFILKEFRKYPFFFLLLFFTLILGTLGLMGISLVTGQVQDKLAKNSLQLLTSDIAVSARRELTASEISSLENALDKESKDSYKIIDIYSMVSHLKLKASRLVEIRATELAFPFYGEITLQNGEAFDSKELYISKNLADLWRVEIGDELQVGETIKRVKGIVQEDSSMGLRGFSLAPRIYYPLNELELTGLLKPGATGSYAYHFKLKNTSDDHLQKLKRIIYSSITDSGVKITLPQDSSDQTGRVINTLTNFMALSALIGLILSLVGVFYLYQSHLLARLKDMCLMNIHGLPKSNILLGVLSQFSLIFFCVILFELVLIIPFYKILGPLISLNLGIDLPMEVKLTSILYDIPFLYGLSVLILTPLFLGLMRTSMGIQLKSAKLSMGNFRFYDFIPFLILLWLFSSYLGRSFKVGNIFFFSLMGVFLVSTFLVRGGQWCLRKFISNKGLLLPTIENGIALRSLTRSGHKLTLSFLSLAMGATLISLILQLDRMIMKEFIMDDKKPALFLFDIQEDQMEPFEQFSNNNKTPLSFVTPLIRARLLKINEQSFVRKKRDFDFRAREEDEDARFRNNSLYLTYRPYLTDAEKILEGTPFPEQYDERRLPFISIEKRWSERMGIKRGDKLTFDIQGVNFEGEVLNIKEIKWTSFYPNFFVTIEPGAIEAAPKTFLAVLPSVPKDVKVNYQRRSVEQFPNISFIDVEELVKRLSSLFERSREAIEIISWLSLTVGLVILYGLSHDQVYRRYYDLALLKSLGLSARSLRLNLIYEFGTLFFAAVVSGLFMGWIIAQTLGSEIFKIPLTIDWARIFYPGILLLILCLFTILASSWRAVNAKPRELLSES